MLPKIQNNIALPRTAQAYLGQHSLAAFIKYLALPRYGLPSLGGPRNALALNPFTLHCLALPYLTEPRAASHCLTRPATITNNRDQKGDAHRSQLLSLQNS